jgi:rod shape-determining protein MreC
MSSLFANDSSQNRSVVICICLSLILLFIDSRTDWLKSSRYFLSYLKPVVEIPAYSPGQFFNWASENFKSRQELLKENENLRNQVLFSQRRVQRFASLTAENIRLRELLGSSSLLSDSVLVAEIIAFDVDPYRHEIVLDKGQRDGVFVGMPFIDASGLMGQVTAASAFNSKGLLITDMRHGLSVEVVRNGVRAMALGTGLLNELSLSHVTETTDIEVDDILVSSGLDGRFPKGYPVGMVRSIEHHVGRQFSTVIVTPVANLDKTRHVLLIFKEGASWESMIEADDLDKSANKQGGKND